MKIQKLWIEETEKLTQFGLKITTLDIVTRLVKTNLFYKEKHKAILKYLSERYKEIIQKYRTIDLFASNIQPTDPIWVFWYQGFDQAPILVQQCLKSLKKNAGKHPVIELDRENYMNYVKIPKYIMEKFNAGKISVTQFSDILRVSLLDKYGGCWSDATIYYDRWLDENVQNLSWYSLKSNPQNRDFRYVSNYMWSSFFQMCGKNCVIVKFVKEMLYAYWKEYDLPIDYFLQDNIIAIGYQQIDSIKKLIDETPYNNPNVAWLSQNLNDKYTKNVYDTIRKNTSLFKLNWRAKVTLSKDTYGEELLMDKIKR